MWEGFLKLISGQLAVELMNGVIGRVGSTLGGFLSGAAGGFFPGAILGGIIGLATKGTGALPEVAALAAMGGFGFAAVKGIFGALGGLWSGPAETPAAGSLQKQTEEYVIEQAKENGMDLGNLQSQLVSYLQGKGKGRE